MSWWDVIDTSDWHETRQETRGLREKVWIVDPRAPDVTPWLRKSPRASRPTEPAVEAFTLELARRCGLEVAHGRASTWGTGDRGFVSRRFHDETEEQYTGAELFDFPLEESRTPAINATFGRVCGLLGSFGAQYSVELERPFLRTVAFDAWIGNGDRHLGNWALLFRGRKECRFAPMFDTAGCLGTELQDDNQHLRAASNEHDLERYASRCKSGFGDGVSVPGIQMTSVLDLARRSPRWMDVCHELLPRFRTALATDVEELLAEVPTDWWSNERRIFARRLLEVRVKLLERAIP